MKISKATLKRINKNQNIFQVYLVSEILRKAEFLEGDAGHYDVLSGIVVNDGTDFEYISGRAPSEYGKRIFAGMATKYPKYISVTVTNGFNSISIYKPNELVRELLKEN